MRDVGGIVTPEAVLLRFETAGVPSRSIAKVLDLLISGAFVVIVLLGAAATGPLSESSALLFVGVATTVALFAYPAVAEARWGRTLGKAAVGLVVVTAEGAPARARHTTIRAALQVVDFLLVPIGVVAVLSALASPLDQRFGDRVAGTLVLRARAGSDDARAVAFPPLPGYEAYVASMDVSGVSPEQYEVLRSFLTRVQVLEPVARLQLAESLARPLGALLRQPPPPTLHPELYCACVASAYQRRHGGPTW